MHELAAWILFPLIALAICTGIGILAERLARAELHSALLPALGFAAAIVVLGPLFATGVGEWPAFALLAVLAIAGCVPRLLARLAVECGTPRGRAVARLRPGLGAAVGVAVYALHIAPVALSGQATFLGYNLLNDTAIHLALVDWIGDHGSRFIEQAPSSYGATINDYVESRYPVGSHELLAALKPAVGLDPALLYQPFLALCAGIAAAAIFAVLRESVGSRLAALAGFAALASQLVFSFALQGGIKEIGFIVCLSAAAGIGAAMRRSRRAAGLAALLALPAAALYGIYGIYALPWIAPLAAAALVLGRPGMRAALSGVGVFLVAIAVDIPDSLHYYNHGHSVITSGAELGPLAGPLNSLQVTGIWLNGDYRFAPAAHAWITYLLAGIALALAVGGVVVAFRRRSAGPLLLLLPALVAWALTAPASSPYIDAKLLAILSPAIVVAACLGIAALPRRRIALAAAVVLGGALLVSDALAYRVALLAPVDRLGELTRIDKRFAGQGPILVNEFEEYVKHYMPRSRGSEPYETWTAGRAQLRDPQLPVAAHAYDLDQMKTSFIERWRLIAQRRSPAQSRPPSNYERVWSGRFYEVWKRVRPAPLAHFGLGKPPLDPTEPLDCSLVRDREGSGRVVAALRVPPRIAAVSGIGSLPPGWYRDPRDAYSLDVRKGGSISTALMGGGNVRLWLRGRTFRDDRVLVDGRLVGVARHLNGPNQWIDVGALRLAPGRHVIELRRPKRSLRPGDAQTDVIGPFAATAGEPVLVGGPELLRHCGQPADWIDVLPG